jgi:serine/threonine protein kinase
LTEVQFLGVVEHPNLVKLIGYCAVDGERGIQRLLVYEYMSNRSLEAHLFNKAYDPVPWKTRLEIVLGAAQGLMYLHEELEVQVPIVAL